ncbi:TPA: hypothetical protein NIA54_002196 [Pseudomonas aeruginosa]|nr:hypothetical protein [Pseudomonas aeruginosa]
MNPTHHTCCDCGYVWPHGADASHSCVRRLVAALAEQRQVTSDAITGALASGAQGSPAPEPEHWLRPFYDIGRAEGQRTQELAMLVRMLASSLKRHAPESNLVARATNYLAAKGLAGTPLRDAPASVEQAGGDERAAFEQWLEQHMSHHFSPELDLAKYEDSGEYRYNPAADYWKAWQARAALAQPSPVRSSLLINGYQLRAALDFIAPDGTAEQLESEACIEWRQQDADFLEAGLYAFCAEYPEEGGVLLDEEPTNSQPSPALPPFADKVLAKLRRFYDCASDFESGGVDIGRHWLDLLTQLGLLNRVQRSPALWEISQQGEDLLGAPQHFPARTEQENSGYDQLWAWFGLSRSAYAVLPRVMMHAMPDEWQGRFAELMDEWDDHWPNQPDITAHVQIKQNNRFISTPPWLLNYRHPDHNQLNAMRGKDEL